MFLVAQLVKNLLQCRRPGFDPWVGKIPWRRKWQSTPVSCLKNPMDRGIWQSIVNGVPRVRYDLATKPPPMSLRVIYVVAWVRIAFHYIVYHILFVIHWTFEHVHLLAVVNNAAMDSGVWIPVWVPAFNSFGYMSKGGIARSYGNYRASLVAQQVKNLPGKAGDPGLIPGLGRSPGEGKGNPRQYFCLENPMEQRSLDSYSLWGLKNQTQLSN